MRGRDLAGAVAEAQEKTQRSVQAALSRRTGAVSFRKCEKAEHRLMIIIPLSLALIFILLYLAFRSLLDALSVLSNVVALSLGGIWALC